MINASIFGRLTKDVELKQGQTAQFYVFTLAVNHGKNADNSDRTTFVDCTAFGKTGELIAGSCKKGNRLLVAGSLEEKAWSNQTQGTSGKNLTCSVRDFNFVEYADQNGQQQPPQQPQQYNQPPQPNYGQQPPQYGQPVQYGQSPQQPQYGQQQQYNQAPPPMAGGQPPVQQQNNQGQPPMQQQQQYSNTPWG
ncbi:MAG: single-strand binding protein [Firmicutes bacterium]|nr:single-strand binding protein [Bacillota bacterium]